MGVSGGNGIIKREFKNRAFFKNCSMILNNPVMNRITPEKLRNCREMEDEILSELIVGTLNVNQLGVQMGEL